MWTAPRPRTKEVQVERSSSVSPNRRGPALVALCMAAFVISLDTTIVNVALPSLVRQLDASVTDLQWVVDAYSLVFAALILAAGSLSDRLGRKGILMAGLGLFGAASLAGSAGSSVGQLVAARAVMGLGAALIFPATLSIISNIFTRRAERARAIGLWGATTGVGIALGPIMGGWLLERFWWGSVFLFMAPVAAGIALLVSIVVPPSRDPTAPPVDWAGLVMSAAGMGALIFTIIEAPDAGWGSGRTIAGFAAGVAILAGFLAGERCGHRGVLRAVGVHLPGHPVLPVPQGLQPACHRRPAAAGGRLGRDLVGGRDQARGQSRQQAGGDLGADPAEQRVPVDLHHLRCVRLPGDRGPDAGAGDRDGSHQRAGDGGHHGRGLQGEGRGGLRGQRRHPVARRNAGRGRDRQRRGLAVRGAPGVHPAEGSSPGHGGGGEGIGWRRHHRRPACRGRGSANGGRPAAQRGDPGLRTQLRRGLPGGRGGRGRRCPPRLVRPARPSLRGAHPGTGLDDAEAGPAEPTSAKGGAR